MVSKRKRWFGEEGRVERLAERGIDVRSPEVMEYQTCGSSQCVDTYNDNNNCGECGFVVSTSHQCIPIPGPLYQNNTNKEKCTSSATCYKGECTACGYENTLAARTLKRACPDSVPYCGVGELLLPIRKATGLNMWPHDVVYPDGPKHGGIYKRYDFDFVNGTVVER